MLSIEKSLQTELQQLQRVGQERRLPGELKGVDFVSNDFLGFARDASQPREGTENESPVPNFGGSTGSRLISGDNEQVKMTERAIASIHRVEGCLLLPAGYLANLALFSALPKRHDAVIHDSCIHRSCIDGVTLSGARRWTFRHNDLNHLEELLKRNTQRSWIAVESLYSMEGDLAPLEELLGLSNRYDAPLIVDEAHAIGVWGYGLVSTLGLTDQVFATIVTYGKAMGQAGAAILGAQTLMDYLINRASPVMYSTALMPLQAALIQRSYTCLDEQGYRNDQLQQNIDQFRKLFPALPGHPKSPIQPIRLSLESNRLNQLAAVCQQTRLHLYYVRSPSVRKGEERLRVCLHSYNTKREIDYLWESIKPFIYA